MIQSFVYNIFVRSNFLAVFRSADTDGRFSILFRMFNLYWIYSLCFVSIEEAANSYSSTTMLDYNINRDVEIRVLKCSFQHVHYCQWWRIDNLCDSDCWSPIFDNMIPYNIRSYNIVMFGNIIINNIIQQVLILNFHREVNESVRSKLIMLNDFRNAP